ncbi:hypothetical protein RRG51_00625 [Mycoplasmopsis cynos]|uniref:hypothetical protein n=1 Tax=Mycoplasmopsis cynos TaxID=171284 RepID=UPI002AFE20EC|nr:hypothetical protein [Mycoplasmopsis cynos]WQQ16259.1 hypothetical protein RRG51_00625 [Mycoplasmopsis cynos]
MKKNKLILPAVGLFGVAVAGTAIACSKRDGSEEIVVAVDGVQKKFYEKAIEIYNKTPSAKKFKIKMIEKDVFGAIDINTQGITDKRVADIFYMPADRVTDFTQRKNLVQIEDFLPGILDDIAKEIGASEKEKEAMRYFGTIKGRSKANPEKQVTKLMAIRHNTEGLILASTKEESEARSELQNTSYDTLIELVKTGKALFRFQDFWFGNGILAGAFEKIKSESTDAKIKNANLMEKIIYTKYGDARVSSGFQAGNEYHEAFKKATKVMSDLFFPIYEAAYVKTEAEFKETVWGKKGISQGDLKAILDKNVGDAQNRIFQLMKDKKIDYTVIGSWDSQNSEKSAGVRSFFNVVKTDENNEYLQGPGSWAYGINARNNGAKPERRKALREFLKAIFKAESYKEYFLSDSKIPFTNKFQTDLANDLRNENDNAAKEVNNFAKELKFENYTELYNAAKKEINDISELAKQGPIGNDWSSDKNKTKPSDVVNETTKEDNVKSLKRPSVVSETEFKKTTDKIQATLPLRNVVATILGLDNLDNLKGTSGTNKDQPWLVGQELLKPEAIKSDGELKDAIQGGTALHVRKVQKFIFGVDGDDQKGKEDLIEKLKNDVLEDQKNGNSSKINQAYEEVFKKAKDFAAKYSKNAVPSDDILKNVTKKHLDIFLNAAIVRASISSIFENTKFKNKDNTDSKYSFKEVDAKISEFEGKSTFNKLLKVFSSTKEIKDGGIGIFKTQATRPDNSNPQFGPVWGYFNDLTFGNNQKYEEFKAKGIKTEKEFADEIFKTLQKLFADVSSTLQRGNSATYVEF